MSREEDKELKLLEAQLAALRPRTDRLDRDRLMYLAGRESALSHGSRAQRLAGRAARWAWPSMTAALTAVSAVLAVLLFTRPNVPRIVVIPIAPGGDQVARTARETPPSGQVAVSQDSGFPGPTRYGRLTEMLLGPPSQGCEVASLDPYPRLRNQVLQRGLDAWRDPPRRGRDAARSDEAAAYRDLIDNMLDGSSSQPSPRLSPVMPLSLGAHS